ncbi:hypothetical protein Bbelb_051670 [Branchiostoma belcheri]|nr:hypothetical protein Bbelb_051670 [Branchiostoma belcheri]
MAGNDPPPLHGYIKSVSPIKVGNTGSKFFRFEQQDLTFDIPPPLVTTLSKINDIRFRKQKITKKYLPIPDEPTPEVDREQVTGTYPGDKPHGNSHDPDSAEVRCRCETMEKIETNYMQLNPAKSKMITCFMCNPPCALVTSVRHTHAEYREHVELYTLHQQQRHAGRNTPPELVRRRGKMTAERKSFLTEVRAALDRYGVEDSGHRHLHKAVDMAPPTTASVRVRVTRPNGTPLASAEERGRQGTAVTLHVHELTEEGRQHPAFAQLDSVPGDITIDLSVFVENRIEKRTDLSKHLGTLIDHWNQGMTQQLSRGQAFEGQKRILTDRPRLETPKRDPHKSTVRCTCDSKQHSKGSMRLHHRRLQKAGKSPDELKTRLTNLGKYHACAFRHRKTPPRRKMCDFHPAKICSCDKCKRNL